MTQTVTLVTGATDGIGLAIARRSAERGDRIVGIGSRPGSKADPLFQSHHYISADFREPEHAVTRIMDGLRDFGITHLSRLIHNAGLGWVGDPLSQTTGSVRDTIAVDLTAPVFLTRALVPHVERGSGSIVFVGSTAAGAAPPDFAVYGAAKAAISGFARSLRIELQDRIPVALVHPGPTRTAMHEKAGLSVGAAASLFLDPNDIAADILMAADTAEAELRSDHLRFLSKPARWLKSNRRKVAFPA